MSVTCCKCGSVAGEDDWMLDGWLRIEINDSGVFHYGCAKCRGDGFDLIKHAALADTGDDECAEAKEAA